MNYTIIRSSRRSVALEVTADGAVVVRAPHRMRAEAIEAFVRGREGWIARARGRQANRAASQTDLSPDELRARAERDLPMRLEAWAVRMGVTPSGLRITGAEKRLGSCSGDDHICLSFNLMRWPDAVIDYVVVHELAHIRHKNHSAAFYAEIERYLPTYRNALDILRGRKEGGAF